MGIQEGLLGGQHFQVTRLAVVHEFMRSLISVLQHFHLAMIIAMFLDGRLAIGQGFIDLAACIDDGLHILVHQVLLLQLVDFQVGFQLALGIDGLGQRRHGIKQNLAGIHDSAASAIGPSGQSLQTDGRIKGGTGNLCVIERLFHGQVGQLDVGTVAQQRCRHTRLEAPGQRIGAQTAARNRLRRYGQQTAQGVLHLADIAPGIHNRRFHAQVG